jgi:hypothetical protein
LLYKHDRLLGVQPEQYGALVLMLICSITDRQPFTDVVGHTDAELFSIVVEETELFDMLRRLCPTSYEALVETLIAIGYEETRACHGDLLLEV